MASEYTYEYIDDPVDSDQSIGQGGFLGFSTCLLKVPQTPGSLCLKRLPNA